MDQLHPRRRALRVAVAATSALGLGLLAASSAGASNRSSVALPLCAATSGLVPVAPVVASIPGGTTVTLTFTNATATACALPGAPSVILRNASGVQVGPTSAAPSTTSVLTLAATHQVALSVHLVEGVNCTVGTASKVSVTFNGVPGPTIALPSTVGVCTSPGSLKPVVSGYSLVAVAHCTSAQLQASAGAGSGAAGTIYYPLSFTNVSAAACSVSGIPVVQPVTTAGAAAGPAAAPEVLPGDGGTVVLGGTGLGHSPLRSAVAQYGVTESGNYTPSTCRATVTSALKVSLTGVAGSFHLPLRISVCTARVSTHISGVTAS